MNRANFHWLLSSVLPHVGVHGDTAFVTLSSDAEMLFAVATDRYSLAISRIPYIDLPPLDLRLTAPEVKAVLRLVKPTLVAHRDETVEVAVRPAELHLATSQDSAVFDTAEPSEVTVGWAFRLAARILLSMPVVDVAFDPDLLAKFAKAKREETDRLVLYPTQGATAGLAVVTVGDNFLGVVAGVGDDYLPARSPMLDLLEQEVRAA